MNTKPERDYFRFTLNCYDQSGLRKSSKFLQKFVSLYILYPVMYILLFMIIYNFRFKHNIVEFAEVFGSAAAYANLLFRKTLILAHGKTIEEMISHRSSFWAYDLFGKAVGDKLRDKMNFCFSFIQLLLVSCTFSLVSHAVAPLFVEKYLLPHPCWIPGNNFTMRVVLYVVETVLFMETIFMLAIFDAFYLLMCTSLKIQFKLLRKAVETIKIGTNPSEDHENSCWMKLKECTIHHKFLLGMHQKLNKISSEYFVCQYFLTISETCIPLFVILDENTRIVQILEHLSIAVIINVVCAMYFLPAGEIEIEASNLASAVYNIDWYNTKNLKIRRFILFWLQKTQTAVEMTGAGIVKVNRPVLLQVRV
ncbi:odorant receptor 43a-like [Tenebrio molitor]|uniref:odorant receptor 43a-like n=1 Tax=Tenebrio molitor TaxID=7067 RepID=UPI00362499E2